MKILYVSTCFPRESESSTIYTDLAEELIHSGHKVTVVAADERKNGGTTRIEKERGCCVLRVKTGNMYNVGYIEKGISLISLTYLMNLAIFRFLRKNKYDLILFEAPPVTLSGVVRYSKNLFHCPSFLMMKDIFPQNAIDIGIMNSKSFTYKYFKNEERKLYDVADNIGCMSKANMKYLEKHSNVSSEKLSLFPNTKKLHPVPVKSSLPREKYNIPKEKIVFVFGGNMGKPQGMDFLSDCIIASESVDNAFFVLVGRGTEKSRIKTKLQTHNNAIVLDNLPREEYEELIVSCDVGIVSLDYRFTIPNYPSRILSYMEYGIPVLATTDVNTDFKDLIVESKCGYWCESNNVAEFVHLIKKLCSSNREEIGRNGREYYEKNFTVDKSVQLLEQYFRDYQMKHCIN